jgi:hypothetical protein
MMNWDAISAVGEIVGAIAVVATLIYLARQIKDSARAARSQAITNATTGMQAFYQEVGSNPQTCELFLEGFTNPEALSGQAQFQFVMLVHTVFLGYQRGYYLAQEGTLDEGFRDSVAAGIVAVNQLPGVHLYWRQRKAFFQPEFADWVEGLLDGEPLTDMDAYHRRSSLPAEQ